jgi:hypothetical protein
MVSEIVRMLISNILRIEALDSTQNECYTVPGIPSSATNSFTVTCGEKCSFLFFPGASGVSPSFRTVQNTMMRTRNTPPRKKRPLIKNVLLGRNAKHGKAN